MAGQLVQILAPWPEATPTPGVDVRYLSEVERRHAYARRWVDRRMAVMRFARAGVYLGDAMRALALTALGAGPALIKAVRLAQEAELDAAVERMWDHDHLAPAPPCVDPTSPF
jgi:hypothetical protein